MLRTSSNTLYIGQTNNLDKRIREHLKQTGVRSLDSMSMEQIREIYPELYENARDMYDDIYDNDDQVDYDLI